MEPVAVGKPESLRKTRLMVAVSVIAALAVSTGVYLVSASDSGVTVNVTSITLHIGYASSSDNYFGNAVQRVTANYETYGSGQIASFIVPFHNYDSKVHSLSTLFVKAPGFEVVSENPALPVSVNPGQTVYITVEIKVPTQNFAGSLDLYSVVQ